MLDLSLKALATIYKHLFSQKSGNVSVFRINLTSGGLMKHSGDFILGFDSESGTDLY